MPALSDIVLTDGTDNHTFKPRGIDGNGVAAFVESSGVPMGNRLVTMARGRTAAGREKVNIKITIPVVQDVVVNGVSKPTLVRTAYCEASFTFDGTSNTGERNDIRNYLQDLLGETVMVALVDNLEYLYGA